MSYDRTKYTSLVKVDEQLNGGKKEFYNSLTPDDRLFLAYLAAKIRACIFACAKSGSTHSNVIEDAKSMCENYKEQEK